MKSKKTLLALAVALVVLLGGASVLYSKLSGQLPQENMTQEAQSSAQEQEFQMAPDFTVEDAAGNPVRLSDFQGKPAVVNFWASWCSPCKSEMPEFESAYAEYGEDIHFLMVNLTSDSKETREQADALMAETGYTFPVYYDTEGSAAAAYGIYSIPMTLFIDKDGYLVAYGSGMLTADSLQTGIDYILER